MLSDHPLPPGGSFERRVTILNRAIWAAAAIIEILVAVRIILMLAIGIKANLTGTFGANPAITDFYAITGVYVDLFDGATNFVIRPPGQAHVINTAGVLGMISMFFGPLAITKTTLWYARKRDAGEKPIVGWIRPMKTLPHRLIRKVNAPSDIQEE